MIFTGNVMLPCLEVTFTLSLIHISIALEELPDLPMLHCRLSNYSRRLLDSWWQHNFSRPPS